MSSARSGYLSITHAPGDCKRWRAFTDSISTSQTTTAARNDFTDFDPIGRAKMGPSNTNEWHSPFSPRGGGAGRNPIIPQNKAPLGRTRRKHGGSAWVAPTTPLSIAARLCSCVRKQTQSGFRERSHGYTGSICSADGACCRRDAPARPRASRYRNGSSVPSRLDGLGSEMGCSGEPEPGGKIQWIPVTTTATA
jgi:hypothetical protein